jgi:calcineurin-like phosphoesterase family protein
MSDFFTSDLHFNHENIIAYCNRPFSSVEEMNRIITLRWNSVVKDSDTTYMLGDFALGPKWKWPEFRAHLNGRIVFIRGNHDYPTAKFNLMMLPDDIVVDDYRYESDSDYGDIHLAHIPMRGDPDRGYVRSMVEADPDDTMFFCGHVHNAWTVDGGDQWTTINVGCDRWGFTPRTLDEILSAVG